MKQPVFVMIKPDGIAKGLVGEILQRFSQARLELIAMKLTVATREQAEEHYANIKGTPFFKGVVEYLLGKYHGQRKLLQLIFYGDNAIKECRRIVGATNPEEANPKSIRGAFGRITTSGLYENLVHVSSSPKDTKREIQLWFSPEEILKNIYETKTKNVQSKKMRVWK